MRCSVFMVEVAVLLLFDVRKSFAQCPSRPSVTVMGRFVCRGMSVSRTNVVLEHKINFMDNTIGVSQTLEDGSFVVEGLPHVLLHGEIPRLSIRLGYVHESDESYIRMRQADDIEIEQEGDVIDMGEVQLDTDKCGAYTSFYAATMDYYTRVGEKVPTRVKVQRDLARVDTPYSLYTEVIFARGYVWSVQAAQHELAHVIRHYYDGDEEHFQKDAEKYGSEQFVVHDCESDTNDGFAFNEGWALFWQGACMDSDPDGSHSVEGHVASALRALQETCGSSAAQMWDVLKENGGDIHAFDEYKSRHSDMFGCP